MGNREELIERTIKWLSTLAELTDDEGDAGAYLQTVSLIQSMCLALSEAGKETAWQLEMAKKLDAVTTQLQALYEMNLERMQFRTLHTSASILITCAEELRSRSPEGEG